MNRRNAAALERKSADNSAAPAWAEIKSAQERVLAAVEQSNKVFDELKKSDALIEEKAERALKSLEEAKAEFKTLIAKQEANIEKLRVVANDNAEDVEAKKAADLLEKTWDSYLRKGIHGLNDEERKTISTLSDPDGGYMARPEVSNEVTRIVSELSPVRAYAQVQTIGARSFVKYVNMGGSGVAWVEELGTLPDTNTPKLAKLDVTAHKLVARPQSSREALEDTAINVEEWLQSEVGLEIATEEGRVFLSGNGVSKPRGLLTYPAGTNWGQIQQIGSGVNGGLPAFNAGTGAGPQDPLIDVITSIKAPYRQNSRWYMNRNSIGRLTKLKDADGRSLIQTTVRNEGLVESLLGYTIVELPDMPDFATGSLSVMFGDLFRGYLIVDRLGLQIERDTITQPGRVIYNCYYRVGGEVQMFEAIKLLRLS